MLRSGSNHTCYLKNGKSILCWGESTHHQTTIHPHWGNKLESLALGAHHTCVLIAGRISCVGKEYIDLTDGNKMKYIAMGVSTLCAIGRDDTLQCWGDKDTQGINTIPTDLRKPLHQVEIGQEHICVIHTPFLQFQTDRRQTNMKGGKKQQIQKYGSRKSEKLSLPRPKCWGRDKYGQTTIGNSHLPSAGRSSTYKISLGVFHSCRITSIGNLCWGLNRHGQLDLPSGLEVQGHLSAISAGGSHTCGLVSRKTVFSFDGVSISIKNVKVEQVNDNDLQSGFGRSGQREGMVQCWGSDEQGQLGGQHQQQRSIYKQGKMGNEGRVVEQGGEGDGQEGMSKRESKREWEEIGKGMEIDGGDWERMDVLDEGDDEFGEEGIDELTIEKYLGKQGKVDVNQLINLLVDKGLEFDSDSLKYVDIQKNKARFRQQDFSLSINDENRCRRNFLILRDGYMKIAELIGIDRKLLEDIINGFSEKYKFDIDNSNAEGNGKDNSNKEDIEGCSSTNKIKINIEDEAKLDVLNEEEDDDEFGLGEKIDEQQYKNLKGNRKIYVNKLIDLLNNKELEFDSDSLKFVSMFRNNAKLQIKLKDQYGLSKNKTIYFKDENRCRRNFLILRFGYLKYAELIGIDRKLLEEIITGFSEKYKFDIDNSNIEDNGKDNLNSDGIECDQDRLNSDDIEGCSSTNKRKFEITNQMAKKLKTLDSELINDKLLKVGINDDHQNGDDYSSHLKSDKGKENKDFELTNINNIQVEIVKIDIKFNLLSTGLNHTCAVSSEDQIVCFGSSQQGQLNVPSEYIIRDDIEIQDQEDLT